MANIVLGLFSPFKFELPNYKGYDITKFKNNIRFLKVYINRDGDMGGVCPLFFDGAVCQFEELPKPDSIDELQKIYTYINYLKNKTDKLFFKYSIKNYNNNLKVWKRIHTFANKIKYKLTKLTKLWQK